MKRFRNLALVLIGAIGVLVVGEATMRAVSDYVPPPQIWPSVETDLKHEQLLNDNSYDVLFLGSSVTEAAIDPDLLGIDAYNSGLPFSSARSDTLWYQLHFDDSPPPIVVLGVPVWPDHRDNDDDVLGRGIETAASFDDDGLLHSSLVTQRGLLADWFERSQIQEILRLGPWTDRGHQTLYGQRSGESLHGRFGPFGSAQMSQDAENSIFDLVDTLQNAGSSVVIMVEPGRFPGEVTDEEIEASLENLRQIAVDAGVPFWDAYSIEWDPALFADEAHFNRQGTEAFTAYLRPLLESQLP